MILYTVSTWLWQGWFTRQRSPRLNWPWKSFRKWRDFEPTDRYTRHAICSNFYFFRWKYSKILFWIREIFCIFLIRKRRDFEPTDQFTRRTTCSNILLFSVKIFKNLILNSRKLFCILIENGVILNLQTNSRDTQLVFSLIFDQNFYFEFEKIFFVFLRYKTTEYLLERVPFEKNSRKI